MWIWDTHSSLKEFLQIIVGRPTSTWYPSIWGFVDQYTKSLRSSWLFECRLPCRTGLESTTHWSTPAHLGEGFMSSFPYHRTWVWPTSSADSKAKCKPFYQVMNQNHAFSMERTSSSRSTCGTTFAMVPMQGLQFQTAGELTSFWNPRQSIKHFGGSMPHTNQDLVWDIWRWVITHGSPQLWLRVLDLCSTWTQKDEHPFPWSRSLGCLVQISQLDSIWKHL